jgi:hypothetical protein
MLLAGAEEARGRGHEGLSTVARSGACSGDSTVSEHLVGLF